VDVGLAAYLLDLHAPTTVERDPLRGSLFENLVVVDILKSLLNEGEVPQAFFYRDSRGSEVDLILRNGRTLTAIEIKSAAAFSPEFLRGIEQLQSLDLEDKVNGLVIYAGSDTAQVNAVGIIPFGSKEYLDRFGGAVGPGNPVEAR